MTTAAPDVPQGYPFQRDLEITPREAAAWLRDRSEETLLIDCREPAEWETSRVEGMLLIPLGEIQARVEEIESLGRSSVAVMCHHGRRSMKAALLLRQLGIENAMSIAGGIEWWSRSVDPGVPRYVKDASGCRVVG